MMIYDLRGNCVIMTHVILTDKFVFGLSYNNNMPFFIMLMTISSSLQTILLQLI